MKTEGFKAVGVIAEYNPFHNGHSFQLAYIRNELHADYIVAAMSGDFVQRGTPALFPKHLRARMALIEGADLVLELPSATATASAEAFASGGISLLAGLGVVDEVCFGSECGSIHALKSLAGLLLAEPKVYSLTLKKALKEGMTYPAARCQALLSVLEDPAILQDPFKSLNASLPQEKKALQELLSSPNNLLGIEYCKAILRQKASLRPVTLRRQGSSYHEQQLTPGVLPSASAIREALLGPDRKDALKTLKGQISEKLLPLLKSALMEGGYLTPEDLDPLFLYRLLKETPESLCQYLDMTPQLSRRIYANRFSFRSFSQFAGLIKTKELTQTRVQRALLHMLLDIRRASFQTPYARVLGFRRDSLPLLRAIKERGTIPLLTKTAQAEKRLSQEALSIFTETASASHLYQGLLSQKTGKDFCHEYRQPLVIL